MKRVVAGVLLLTMSITGLGAALVLYPVMFSASNVTRATTNANEYFFFQGAIDAGPIAVFLALLILGPLAALWLIFSNGWQNPFKR